MQRAESLSCFSCVWEGQQAWWQKRERVRDLRDTQVNGKAQLAEVRGSCYCPWRKCFESTGVSVTPKVTDVVAALRQLKDHVKSMEGILSKAGVRCSVSSLSHCVIAQVQVHGVVQTPGKGQQKGASRQNTSPSKAGNSYHPGGQNRSQCMQSIKG